MKNSPCTGDKKISVGLNAPDALILCGDPFRYYGGDQAWFADTNGKRTKRKIKKGCGIIAAANICSYLAASGEKYSPLYAGQRSRKDFTAHMSLVSEYLKAGAFGIWGIRRFTRGVKAFAASRGIALEAHSIGHFSAEKAAGFIAEALSADKPVAMLIGFNRSMKKIPCRETGGRQSEEKFTAHWVTVTELAGENGKYTVKVSSWGRSAYISLNDYAEKEIFKKALVYFE